MGSRRGVPVTLRMDPSAAEDLTRLAEEDRRTRTAEAEWLIEQELQRRESGAENVVRVERLKLRVKGWKDAAAQLRRQEPLQDETREGLDGMADAYERAAAEIEMEIATRS